MSVINQMLKDLDARQSGGSDGARYQPRARQPLWLLALVTLTCLAGLLLVGWRGWGYWQQTQREAQSLTQVHPAMPASVAAPAPQRVVAAQPVTTPTPTASSEPLDAVVALPLPASAANEESVHHQTDELVVPPGEDPKSFYAKVDAGLQPDRQAEDELADQLASEPQAAVVAKPKNKMKIEQVTLSPDELATIADKKATIAMAKGDLAEAEQQFYLLLEQKPRDVDARKQLSALLYGQGRLSDASRILEEGVRQLPTEPDFRLLLARIALASRQQQAAYDWLAGARPPLAGNLDYYATWAALSQDLGHTLESRELYLQLLRKKPDEGRWWLGLGVAEEKLGSRERALDAYQSARLHGGLGDTTTQWLTQRISALAQQ